jgi:hypothetical protein
MSARERSAGPNRGLLSQVLRIDRKWSILLVFQFLLAQKRLHALGGACGGGVDSQFLAEVRVDEDPYTSAEPAFERTGSLEITS